LKLCMMVIMKNKKLDVIVVGELNIDLVLWDVPMPEYEKEKLATDMRFAMGSSSAITAHNLATIGSKVGFIGKAGKDNFGDFMITQLKTGGVETERIIEDPKLKTGATIVLANPPKKALLTYMGAMTAMTINDIDWDYIAQARHLHLGCYYLQTGLLADVPKLFARAKKLGLTTSLDTNWDPSEEWDKRIYQVLEHTDIFFPNDDEAIRIAHTLSLEEAIEKLKRMVTVLVIKKGNEGALACVENRIYDDGGFQVKAIETTGAGDSFNAGFLHKYLEGADWQECLRFGNACGALAVTAIGGTGAFHDKSNVLQKLDLMMH
jgi:sugar/nucleoside kinase (ribokinase family)